jgi:hypothetical protein
LRLEQFEDRAVPAVAIGTTFAGASGTTTPPPGAEGAVGPNNYVEFVNGNVAVYTKAGVLVNGFPKSEVQFWQDAGLGAPFTNPGLRGPRIVYDPVSDRWFAVEINLSNTGNQVLLARTDNNNPAGQWKAVTYQAVASTVFGDAPTLGVDALGVYVGTINYDTNGGTEVSSTITSIPKVDLLQTTPSASNRSSLTDPNQTFGEYPQPLVNLNPTSSHESVVATPKGVFGRINRTPIFGAGGAGASFGATNQVNVDATSLPGLVRQPDGTQTIDPGDDRLTATVYQLGDLIVAVHTITVNAAGVAATASPGTTDGIRITVLSDSSLQRLAEATYFDNAFDLESPSLAINPQGDMVIGFTRSSALAGSGPTDGNLGAYAVQARIDPNNPANGITFGSLVQLQAGLQPDWHLGGGTSQKWTDHSSTSADPSNPTSFWTTQEYAISGGTSGEWGTNVSQVYVAPRVTGITSLPPIGTVAVGSTVTIKVKFNDVLTVDTTGGTPQLALNSGGTAVYAGGSGTNTLSFTYVVGPGQYASDLDSQSSTSLTLNGATVRDVASALDADVTVPIGNAPGSLALNSNVVVDTTPRVLGVTSTTPDGVYGPGIVIPIQVNFTSAVDVSGTPLLALNTGATAVYASGSGTATLTFDYTIGAGEQSPDLDYAASNALTLNGGSMVDHSRPIVNAALTLPVPGTAGSLSANSNIVIDPAAPSVTNVTSPTPNGTYGFGKVIQITITFTKAVNVTGTPLLALNSGGTASYTSGSGTPTLTFTYTVGLGDHAADLDYASGTALTLNGGTITEPGNNRPALLDLPLPGFNGSLGSNKDLVVDAVPASVTGLNSTKADGSYPFGTSIPITVTFDKPVTVTAAPKLNLNSGGTANYTSGSGTTVLVFTYVVGIGDFATDLDSASAAPFDLTGGQIVDVGTSQPITPTVPVGAQAGSLATNKNLAVDGRPAQATGASSPVANGPYGAGAVIPITVTFDKPVTVTGTPLLALNTGATASYASGSGSTTLTFNYTVGAGESTADLDYASTTPINLNGGTINDQLSNAPAGLTLPAPGTAGSLGANKNIFIDSTPPTVLEFRVLFGQKWFNLLTSSRYDLPWRITGIQVVFSEPIVSGNVQSLTGLTASRVRGLGTNTLTWTISPLTQGSFTAGLSRTGASALKDRAGNPVVAFSQPFKVLYGDVNDDHKVDAADTAAVQASTGGPFQPNPSYNIFADLSGDGIVNLVDQGITRSRKGTSIP